MANQDHEVRAGYAVKVWNQWRAENPDIVPDLGGANLSNGMHRSRNLSGADLKGTDFRRSSMREVDLREANLEGADLSKADLRQANLVGSNLKGAQFEKANLIGASLAGADLSGADLRKAQVDRADLTGVPLKGAKLRKTDLATTKGLTQEQIDGAEGDWTTHLPDGLDRPEGWPRNPAKSPKPTPPEATQAS